jgi:hypothetical protein
MTPSEHGLAGTLIGPPGRQFESGSESSGVDVQCAQLAAIVYASTTMFSFRCAAGCAS